VSNWLRPTRLLAARRLRTQLFAHAPRSRPSGAHQFACLLRPRPALRRHRMEGGFAHIRRHGCTGSGCSERRRLSVLHDLPSARDSVVSGTAGHVDGSVLRQRQRPLSDAHWSSIRSLRVRMERRALAHRQLRQFRPRRRCESNPRASPCLEATLRPRVIEPGDPLAFIRAAPSDWQGRAEVSAGSHALQLTGAPSIAVERLFRSSHHRRERAYWADRPQMNLGVGRATDSVEDSC
jgi:hypothetical protein